MKKSSRRKRSLHIALTLLAVLIALLALARCGQSSNGSGTVNVTFQNLS